MADDREKPSAPGTADDAPAPGAELPPAPTDEEVERAARALGAPIIAKSDESRRAEVE